MDAATKYTLGAIAIIVGYLLFLTFLANPENHKLHYEYLPGNVECETTK